MWHVLQSGSWFRIIGFVLPLLLLNCEFARAQTKQEASALNGRIVQLYQEGKYTEAAPLAEKLVAMRIEAYGEEHLDTAMSFNILATVYRSQGRLDEAETIYERALAVRKKLLSENHPDIATSLNYMAMLKTMQGRYVEAEALFKQALKIREAVSPVSDYAVAVSLNNLGELYRMVARHHEAETIFARALEVLERALGTSEHADYAASLNNLGLLYEVTGRYDDAVSIHQRALAIRELRLPAYHNDIALSLNNLGIPYQRMGRYADAEHAYRRSIQILEKSLPPNHPQLAATINNLGELYKAQGRYAEAEPVLKRSLEMRESSLAASHPDIAQSLSNLGGTYIALKKYDEAEAVLRRAVVLSEASLPGGHPQIAVSISNLGTLEAKRERWSAALDLTRRATATFLHRATSSHSTNEAAGRSMEPAEVRRMSWQFVNHVRTARRVAEIDRNQLSALSNESFRVAQWAMQTEAGKVLSRMAARFGSGDTALAGVVRERQDLEYQRQAADKVLITAMSLSVDRRGDADVRARQRLSEIDTRITAIDTRVRAEFPDYFSLVNPEPLSLEATAGLLKPNEVLLQFLIDREEVFAWAVLPRGEVRWVRIIIERDVLTDKVFTLRCGVDRTQWIATAYDREREGRCLKLTGLLNPPTGSSPLPFRLDVAHELYDVLMGPFADLIKDKDLIIVADGIISALPLHTLVRKKPQGAFTAGLVDYQSIDWLGTHQPVTVLPSVASLRALRQLGKSEQAPDAFVGFGNPLLVGPDGTDRRAWERLACTKTKRYERPRLASVVGIVQKLFRGGVGNVEEVRRLTPLPETTDELCEVARSLGVPDSEIYVGERATETTIKRLSSSGKLARARVVHFATHGLLPGNVSEMERTLAEPALVLTPPPAGHELEQLQVDDGLLTASEIAQLNLNADWIILSACNTAGAEKPGAESLSGLARAFFYAGARALLVSHWEVYSDAAVKLTTKAFGEMRAAHVRKAPIGRAEALRRSMAALTEKGAAEEAHPAYWAPFVVVGEGAQ